MPLLDASTLTGPRVADSQQLEKVLQSTHQRYRAALNPFINFLQERGFSPVHAGEFDDLAVECKNFSRFKKSQFENLVAAIELVVPPFKGELKWCHAVLRGWQTGYVPKHTTPMSQVPCLLFAAHFAADGHQLLGVALLAQKKLGLRPSEVLGIQWEDVTLPEEVYQATGSHALMIGLGVRHGTKAKRAQSVLVRDDPELEALIRWARSVSRPGERLFPYSYEQMRRMIAKISKRLGLEDVKWTPHSPRAGFASDLTALGVEFAVIQNLGRWLSATSLRTYIDVITTASISTTLNTRHLNSAIDYVRSNLFN